MVGTDAVMRMMLALIVLGVSAASGEQTQNASTSFRARPSNGLLEMALSADEDVVEGSGRSAGVTPRRFGMLTVRLKNVSSGPVMVVDRAPIVEFMIEVLDSSGRPVK